MEPSKRSIKELQTVPGIGRSIAFDLCNLGITPIANLRGKNPFVEIHIRKTQKALWG